MFAIDLIILLLCKTIPMELTSGKNFFIVKKIFLKGYFSINTPTKFSGIFLFKSFSFINAEKTFTESFKYFLNSFVFSVIK